MRCWKPDPQERDRKFQRRQVAFQNQRHQRRNHARDHNPEIGLRQHGHIRILPQKLQDRPRPQENRRDQHAKGDRQPQRHARDPAHLTFIAVGGGLCHHRHHRIGKAGAENEKDEEAGAAQHQRGQFGHAVPAHHHRIGHADQDLRQMAADQGHTQKQNRPHMVPV